MFADAGVWSRVGWGRWPSTIFDGGFRVWVDPSLFIWLVIFNYKPMIAKWDNCRIRSHFSFEPLENHKFDFKQHSCYRLGTWIMRTTDYGVFTPGSTLSDTPVQWLGPRRPPYNFIVVPSPWFGKYFQSQEPWKWGSERLSPLSSFIVKN